MSAFLAIGSGLLSSVEQAVSGSGLTIGGIALTEMELPEKMTWGGTQMLAVHKLMGGQRVIDAMGSDDRTLDWSGLLRGGNAVSRARQLDALRNAGGKVVLTWADFSYTVVIGSFEADYTRQGYRVPYRISCVVVPQPAKPSKPGLLDSLMSDISSALGLDGLAATAQQAISVAQAALPVAAVITGGSPAFIAMSSAVGTASGAVGAVQSLAESQLGALSGAGQVLGRVIGAADGLSGIAALQSAASSAGSLAAAVTAGGFVSRAAANLGSASP